MTITISMKKISLFLILFAFLPFAQAQKKTTPPKQMLTHWGFARVSVNIRETVIDHKNQPFDSLTVKNRLQKAPVVAKQIYYIAIGSDKKGNCAFTDVVRSPDAYNTSINFNIIRKLGQEEELLDRERATTSITIKTPYNARFGIAFNFRLTQTSKKIKILPFFTPNYQKMMQISSKYDVKTTQRYIIFTDFNLELLPGEISPFEHD